MANTQEDTNQLTDFHQINEENIDFAYMRKKDNANYRNLCREYMKMIDPPNLEKLAFFIIKKSGERYEEEVNILYKWTQQFKFFQDLNAKQSNITNRLHEKCCAKMKYEKIEKGHEVFMAGDIPEKFYIILNGSVNVLLQKNQDVLNKEIAKYQEQAKRTISKESPSNVQSRVFKLMKKRDAQKQIQEQQRLSQRLHELEIQNQSYDSDQKNENKSDDDSEDMSNSKLSLQQSESDIDQKDSQNINKIELFKKSSIYSPIINLDLVRSESERNPTSGINTPHRLSTLSIKKHESSFTPYRNQYSVHRNSYLSSSPKKNQLLEIPGADKDTSPTHKSNFEQSQLLRVKHNRLENNSQLYRNSILYNAQLHNQINISQQENNQNPFNKPSPSKHISQLSGNQLTVNQYTSNQLSSNQQLPINSKLQLSSIQFQNQSSIASLRQDLQDNQNSIGSFSEAIRKQSTHLQSEINYDDLNDLEPDEKDIESDPIYIGLGQIRLSDISDPIKFIQDGVLKHTYLLSLAKGQMFGELGLLMKKPRAATIIAKEDTEFAVLDAQDYINILQVGEMKKFNRRINFFSQSLLQNCGREVVVKFSYNFEKYKFEKGQYIYMQNESPKFVYLIKKGTIQQIKFNYNQIKKKIEVDEQIENALDYGYVNPKQEMRKQISYLKKPKQYIDILINEYTTGQSLGEMEVMQDCPRNTSALCTSLSATVYALSLKNFLTLLHENKFLVKDFQNQINLKQDYQKKKINLYLDSIKSQNEKNREHIKEREKIIIKNRKFNKNKESPSNFDSVFKPSLSEINQIELSPLQQIEDKKEVFQRSPKALRQSLSLSQNVSTPKKQIHYTPSSIDKQIYTNEQGKRQIDVSDELFENQAFSQFVKQLVNLKKQKLDQFKQHKTENAESNQHIFATMLYVEQLKKQVQSMINNSKKSKLGIVKLKKILHLNGIDLKETLNLELSMMSDDKIKSVLSSSPINSPRQMSNNQQSNRDDDIFDHINEQSVLQEDNKSSRSPKNQKLDDFQNQSFSKVPILAQLQIGNASVDNDLDESMSSPQNGYKNQDWSNFMKRYQEKLKPVRQIDRKSVQIDKTHSNALNEKFFQETLKQKLQEQTDKQTYLLNLQNSFDSKVLSETDRLYSTCGDTERKLLKPRLSNFLTSLNKDDKFDITNRKLSLQNYSMNLENSISFEDNYFVGQNSSKLTKKESEISSFFNSERQNQNNLSANDNVDIQKQNNLDPKKLPRLDFSSTNSQIDSKLSLNHMKSINSQTQQPRNSNNIYKLSLKKIGSQQTPSPHHISMRQQSLKQSTSSENKVVLNSDNSKDLFQSQISQKQPDIQENTKQMQEYYVNAKFQKKNSDVEPINMQNIKSKTSLNQLSTFNQGRKQLANSYISQINLSCGASNIQESLQQSQSRIEDQLGEKSPTQVMKYINRLYPNNDAMYIQKDEEKNFKNQSNLSQNHFFSSKTNLRQVQQQNRYMIGMKMNTLEKFSHRVSHSTQFEGNKQMASNGFSSNRSNREEYNSETFNTTYNQSDRNQKSIFLSDSKKSMSFSSKHNMFRNKPTKLYLIDRYNKDNTQDEKQIQKQFSIPVDMQISKVKMQQTMQNFYQS